MSKTEDFEIIHNEMKICEERKDELRTCKRRLQEEAEERDRKLRKAILLQEQIEDDWYNRNIISGIDAFFCEDNKFLRKLVVDNEEAYYQREKEIDREIIDYEERQEHLSRQLQELKDT